MDEDERSCDGCGETGEIGVDLFEVEHDEWACSACMETAD